MGERDIRSQKLLYHLTALQNLPSIFAHGLLPRADLRRFLDVADSEIIAKRRASGLDKYVPFHWFARNPFDGVVQRARSRERFALIAVHRDLARAENWKVVPWHPLAAEAPRVLDYVSGFDAINWSMMNRRDYRDAECKSVCMAECLAPTAVAPKKFYAVFVADEEAANEVVGYSGRTQVIANSFMFIR